MKSEHMIGCVLLLFVAYLIGVKFPSVGITTLSKLGL